MNRLWFGWMSRICWLRPVLKSVIGRERAVSLASHLLFRAAEVERESPMNFSTGCCCRLRHRKQSVSNSLRPPAIQHQGARALFTWISFAQALLSAPQLNLINCSCPNPYGGRGQRGRRLDGGEMMRFAPDSGEEDSQILTVGTSPSGSQRAPTDNPSRRRSRRHDH